MKNLVNHSVTLIFLYFVLSGCGVGKILKRNSARTAESKRFARTSNVLKARSDITEKEIQFTDSSRYDYKVLIYPRDSFSYSIQGGFHGQAQRVEISGSADQLLKSKLYELGLKTSSTDSSTSIMAESRTVERSVSKELKKRSPIAVLLFAIAFIAVIGWFWWKLR